MGVFNLCIMIDQRGLISQRAIQSVNVGFE